MVEAVIEERVLPVVYDLAGRTKSEVQPLESARPETPTNEYEDMFLRGLQKPDALAELVDNAPGRLGRVFPPNAMPLISPANILALSLRLSKDFDGDLRTRLAWMLACAQSFKYCRKHSEYLPRVSTALMSAVEQRRREGVELCTGVLETIDQGGYM